MKKAFAVVMLVVMMVASLSLAEDLDIRKGTVVIKNYVEFDKISTTTVSITVEKAIIKDVTAGIETTGIRMHYKEAGVTHISFIDIDEINDAIEFLKYIKSDILGYSDFMTRDYKEVSYTTEDGFVIGAYYSSSGNGLCKKGVSFQLDDQNAVFIATEDIDTVIGVFENMKKTLEN